MNIPHRCSRDSCRKRWTFSKPWYEFVRPKRCTCGCTKFVIDRWMLRRGREQRCNCGGYHFPHRSGSKFCMSNPLAAYYAARDRQGITGDELAEVFLDCVYSAAADANAPATAPF